MYVKLDKDYEIKTTLGTIREIERVFGKSFFEIIKDISAMKIDDQIKLLYVGAKKADDSLKEKDFIAACEDNIGIGELIENLERYFYALQYPGLSEEEVQQRIGKKLHQSNLMKQKVLIGSN